MERLCLEAIRGASERYETTVIGPKGCSAYLPDGTKVYEVGRGYIGFILGSLINVLLLRVVARKSYNAIVGGSGLAAFQCVVAAVLFRAKSFVFVHGLDLMAKNTVYRYVFMSFIRRCDIVISNSRNTAKLARRIGVSPRNLEIIFPGADQPDPLSRLTKCEAQSRWNLENSKVVLYVGRIIERKGLRQFVQYCLRDLVQSEPDLILMVAGSESNSKNSGLIDSICELASQQGLDGCIRWVGAFDNEELLSLYRAAGCLIFPLVEVDGDVEGFGIVAVEAAAHGIPAVAFDLGGVSDAVADGVSGWLVEPGDYVAFSAAVTDCLRAEPISAESCAEHAKQFTWTLFRKRFLDVLSGKARGCQGEA